jgi:hypothetical protein
LVPPTGGRTEIWGTLEQGTKEDMSYKERGSNSRLLKIVKLEFALSESLSSYNYGNKIQDYKVGRACGTYDIEEKREG